MWLRGQWHCLGLQGRRACGWGGSGTAWVSHHFPQPCRPIKTEVDEKIGPAAEDMIGPEDVGEGGALASWRRMP